MQIKNTIPTKLISIFEMTLFILRKEKGRTTTTKKLIKIARLRD
jgi:hypothetical protein